VYGQGGSLTSASLGTSHSGLNGPSAVTPDSNGGIYLADSGNNRVFYYPGFFAGGPTLVYGQSTVDGYAAPSSATCTTLSSPGSIALDAIGGVYIADTGYSRVLYFPKGSTTATQVFGVPSQSSGTCSSGLLSNTVPSSTNLKLSLASGIAFDPTPGSGGLYVADTGFNRVVFYPVGGGTSIYQASQVWGQSGSFTTASNTGCSASTLNAPTGIALDSFLNLYVADTSNNRVLMFSSTTKWSASVAATAVWGQSTLTGCSRPTVFTASGLNAPSALTLDSLGGIYISSLNNNVAYFSTQTVPGIAASAVGNMQYGQSSFGSATQAAPGPASLSNPAGLGVDIYGGLYIADKGYNRVLYYPGASPGVVNRGFEDIGSCTFPASNPLCQGQPTGWTLGSGTNSVPLIAGVAAGLTTGASSAASYVYYVQSGNSPFGSTLNTTSGSYYIALHNYLAPAGNLPSVSQVVSTIPGVTYTVNVVAASRSYTIPNLATLCVFAPSNGTQIYASSGGASPVSPPSGSWTTYTYQFVAAAGTSASTIVIQNCKSASTGSTDHALLIDLVSMTLPSSVITNSGLNDLSLTSCSGVMPSPQTVCQTTPSTWTAGANVNNLSLSPGTVASAALGTPIGAYLYYVASGTSAMGTLTAPAGGYYAALQNLNAPAGINSSMSQVVASLPNAQYTLTISAASRNSAALASLCVYAPSNSSQIYASGFSGTTPVLPPSGVWTNYIYQFNANGSSSTIVIANCAIGNQIPTLHSTILEPVLQRFRQRCFVKGHPTIGLSEQVSTQSLQHQGQLQLLPVYMCTTSHRAIIMRVQDL